MKESTENAVKETIVLCQWITDLKSNWDDEGSEGYSLATFDKAVYTFWRITEILDEGSLRKPLPMPKIAPANKGSIDLSWDMNGCQLLVNVPSDNNGFATYYGSNDRGESISGKIAIAKGTGIQILGLWLS